MIKDLLDEIYRIKQFISYRLMKKSKKQVLMRALMAIPKQTHLIITILMRVYSLKKW